MPQDKQPDLTIKQQRFIDEYLISNNATDAARRAGYSEKTARAIGSENLTKPYILSEIERRLKEKHLTMDVVLSRLATMATSNLSDYAKIQTMDDLEKAREKGVAIKKFKREITTDQLGRQHEKIELELYDAQSALVHIAKQLQLAAGQPTEIVKNVSLTDEERESRITAIFDRARARRTGLAVN